jgi:hypothetical protein
MLSEYRISEADNAAYIMTKKYSSTEDKMEFDDFHSAILECIFTKCDDSMNLCQILSYARWAARGLISARAQSALHLDELAQVLDDDNDDEYSRYNLDALAATAQMSPEDEVIQREDIAEILDTYARLTPHEQKCISLYALGFRVGDPEIKRSNKSNYHLTVKRAKAKLRTTSAAQEWTQKLAVIHGYQARHKYIPRNWSDRPRHAFISGDPYAPAKNPQREARRAKAG